MWVQISDPAGFVWDSKPYLAPVVAPAEAVEAWQPLVFDIAECASVPVDVTSLLQDMCPDQFKLATPELLSRIIQLTRFLVLRTPQWIAMLCADVHALAGCCIPSL